MHQFRFGTWLIQSLSVSSTRWIVLLLYFFLKGLSVSVIHNKMKDIQNDLEWSKTDVRFSNNWIVSIYFQRIMRWGVIDFYVSKVSFVFGIIYKNVVRKSIFCKLIPVNNGFKPKPSILNLHCSNTIGILESVRVTMLV